MVVSFLLLVGVGRFSFVHLDKRIEFVMVRDTSLPEQCGDRGICEPRIGMESPITPMGVPETGSEMQASGRECSFYTVFRVKPVSPRMSQIDEIIVP